MTHEFYRVVVTGLWGGRWKCGNCGLKVASRANAEQLEGLECL